MLTREGIVRLLEDAGIEVVGQAERRRRRCCAMCAATRPDAAIVDIRMPPTHTDEGLVAAQQDPRRAPRHRRARPLAVRRAAATRCACSRSTPSASATCSRSACSTSRSSSTPCAGSPTARPSSTRRSSRDCSAAAAARTRSTSSPRASARSSRCSPRGCPTARSPRACSSTERTVEAHVTQIFLKLGTRRRRRDAPPRPRRAHVPPLAGIGHATCAQRSAWSKNPITRRSYSAGCARMPPVCPAPGISQSAFGSPAAR